MGQLIVESKFYTFFGGTAPYPKLIMFWAPSQNYQLGLFCKKKNDLIILKQIVWES